MPGDVGWAVIDYIRHGRPEAGCPQVFVKHRYPFTAFGSSTSAGCRLRYYARRAGIVFAAGRSHGLHSLRGALAVAMLQTDTPPPVVTAVLGHATANTTAAHYLRLDTEHLRCCALDVEDVLDAAARGAAVNALTLRELIDTLVAARHAGGFRYKSQERVLRQFAGHCRREGYADGSIVQEAVEGFLYGRHLKASTIRREEIVLRELAEHARQFGWQAWAPPALTRVKTRHRPPPYVFSDEEIRRLFHVIDTQPLSEMSNRALVDPVLFRVFYATGMRLSEALNLELRDFDPARATLEIRDGKNHENRLVPSPGASPPPWTANRGRAPRPRTRPQAVPHRRPRQPGRQVHDLQQVPPLPRRRGHPSFPRRPAHPFAASRLRRAEPAPLGGRRQRTWR